MDAKRFTGPQAGSQKYDLLTALAVAGLCGSPGFQTSMLRLIALVTARYNWARDELTVGQREMARMWSVDERTVKRELKRLTTAGVLVEPSGRYAFAPLVHADRVAVVDLASNAVLGTYAAGPGPIDLAWTWISKFDLHYREGEGGGD